MKDRVGMGVVGAGSIGIRAALEHLSLPDVQDRVYLAAVCDPVPGRAEAAAKKYGVKAWYLTYEELLADPHVDAVTLCTPIGLHYEQGKIAIEAGKHVHFNKTMTTEVWEADDLIARAKAKGIKLVASPGMMLYPHNQRIRRLILEGRLGLLNWAIGQAGGGGIERNYHLNEPIRQGDDVLSNIDPRWYFRRPGGGPQYDVTVYPLHILTGIVGPAKRVTGFSGLLLKEREFRGEKFPCDMDDTTFLLLEFDEAFFAFIGATVAGRIVPGQNPNIYGTAGAVIGTKFGEMDLTQPHDAMPHWWGPHGQMGERHVYEDMMQLVDWIREDKPVTIPTAEHARHVIEIIEAGYRAAETGQTQTLRTTFETLPLEALAELPS
ncbi:MAG: Gfo/Idh/MocA family oxidoreductase [Chloroflexi bacterium]|nr:Gfo/Idh/MocA family oxidoreductase [Chloroflexota bacterium]